ncbi:MAG: hypothetical protein HYV09_13865 [Deltaproteobacteria bacterium]|nr:hypothetical protein [Deltaproteobacteria bacterium]
MQPGRPPPRDEDDSLPRLRATPPAVDDLTPQPGPLPTNTGAMRALAAKSVTLGEPRIEERAATPAPRDRTQTPARGRPATPRPQLLERARPAARSRRRRRISAAFALAILVLGAVGFVGRRAYHQRLRRDAEQAAVRAEDEVRKGHLTALVVAEKELARSFDRDATTTVGARVWIEDRVLRAYCWPATALGRGAGDDGDGDVGLAAAIERARNLGVPAPDLAFAEIALALSSGETRLAAALAREPAGEPANDAWRELAVGWVLERAGDVRAVQRYARAAQLDPGMVPARLALAKQAALSGDAAQVDSLSRDFVGELDAARQDLLALARLVATGTVGRGGPPSVRRPAGFGWIAPALIVADPTAAVDLRRSEAARAASAARDPRDLTQLARLAASTGDEAGASRAVLRAIAASAIYMPARVFVARLALANGHPDDAARALSGIAIGSDPEIAALRAWLAYERGDRAAVAQLLATPTVSAASFERADLAPIVRPLRVALAFAARVDAAAIEEKGALQALADLGELGPSVAFDLALAELDLALAERIGERWLDGQDVARRPSRALRLARLSRLRRRADDADRFSRIAVEQGTVVPLALVERVLVLGAAGKGKEAFALLAKHPQLAVDEQPWLRAWALSLADDPPDAKTQAKKQVEALVEPHDEAPWAVRRDALLALAATYDRRAIPLARRLLRERPRDPDVHAVAKALGLAT